MHRLLYIFVFPGLKLISRLPFPVLYVISDCLSFLVHRVIRYRLAIVRQNLKNSFPGKSDSELKSIEKQFYRHLTDLSLETIKGLTISRKDLLKRMKLMNPEIFDRLNSEGRSCVVVMSHCGNWEWVCLSADISVAQHAQCVYKTLSSKPWDEWFLKLRSRFGTEPFPMEKTLRVMSANSHMVTATAFIGDQNPSTPKNMHWSTFLHQDTCFMMGSEKIAKKLDLEVLYLRVHKVKRGFYESHVEVLEQQPSATADGDITEAIVRATEKDILQQPENWLWSHRRWKHKR